MASTNASIAITMAMLTFLLLWSYDARAGDCPISDQQLVTVLVDAPPAALDVSKSRSEITALSKQTGGTERTIARTEIEGNFDAAPVAVTEPKENGLYCTASLYVVVHVSWEATKYLASELEPDSCMYNVVNREQDEYAAAIQRIQAETDARVKGAIVVAIRKPTPASSGEEGAMVVEGELRKVVSETLTAMMAEMYQAALIAKNPGTGRKICGDAAYEAAFAN